jgi:thiamine pyrophosphate-dependent enzyme
MSLSAMDNTLTSVLAALSGSIIGASTPVLSNFVLQRSVTQRELTNREIAQREELYSEFIRQGTTCYAKALLQSLDTIEELASMYALVNLVHMIWINGSYDMVAVQEQSKYDRTSGVDFGPVDVVKYAEAFGAVGFMIETPHQIGQTLKKAFEIPGPVLIGLRVDYRDNHKLFEDVHERLLN